MRMLYYTWFSKGLFINKEVFSALYFKYFMFSVIPPRVNICANQTKGGPRIVKTIIRWEFNCHYRYVSIINLQTCRDIAVWAVSLIRVWLHKCTYGSYKIGFFYSLNFRIWFWSSTGISLILQSYNQFDFMIFRALNLGLWKREPPTPPMFNIFRNLILVVIFHCCYFITMGSKTNKQTNKQLKTKHLKYYVENLIFGLWSMMTRSIYKC